MWHEYGYTPQQLTNVTSIWSTIARIIFFLQLYGYGCYCLNLGGSPMSGLNELNGVKPMDDIDRTCFHWTRCNRCAAIDYGEKCKAEDRSYDFEIDPDTKDITCKGKKDFSMFQNRSTFFLKKKRTHASGRFASATKSKCSRWNSLWTIWLLTVRSWTTTASARRNNARSENHHESTQEWSKSRPQKLLTLKKGWKSSIEKIGWNKNHIEASRKQCCGDFPKRLPFNENLKQCCDGKVKSHGSCL